MSVDSVRAWLAANAEPLVSQFCNPTRRAAIASRLDAAAPAGHFATMVAILEDEDAREQDAQEAAIATQEMARLDRVLADITTSSELRRALGVQLGREAVSGFGLAALAIMLLLQALG